ncbi:Uncharacterised protein [Bordetella pertussis]|nr:Uncharacterised protein [Bordetella pertussis]
MTARTSVSGSLTSSVAIGRTPCSLSWRSTTKIWSVWSGSSCRRRR